MEKSFDPVKILHGESGKSTLSSISADFYKDAEEYLIQLEQELKDMSPDSTDSTKYALTEDQLNASKSSIESILSQRLRKIIKRVQVDIFERDKNVSSTLTPEENELYTGLLQLIGSWKSQNIDSIVLRKKKGVSVAMGDVGDVVGVDIHQPAVSISSEVGPVDLIDLPTPTSPLINVAPENTDYIANTDYTEKSCSSSLPLIDENNNNKNDFKDYKIVRIIQNVPTFVGIDMREYTLMKNDVATIHTVNARGLINKKAAVEIKPVLG